MHIKFLGQSLTAARNERIYNRVVFISSLVLQTSLEKVLFILDRLEQGKTVKVF